MEMVRLGWVSFWAVLDLFLILAKSSGGARERNTAPSLNQY
jgi:hypothetical protein